MYSCTIPSTKARFRILYCSNVIQYDHAPAPCSAPPSMYLRYRSSVTEEKPSGLVKTKPSKPSALDFGLDGLDGLIFASEKPSQAKPSRLTWLGRLGRLGFRLKKTKPSQAKPSRLTKRSKPRKENQAAWLGLAWLGLPRPLGWLERP